MPGAEAHSQEMLTKTERGARNQQGSAEKSSPAAGKGFAAGAAIAALRTAGALEGWPLI